MVAYLKSAAEKRGWDLAADEIALRRSSSMDLTEEQLQDRLISLIEQGWYHVVICTPPCSTWSRVRMANLRGPPPLRNRLHLWGFPWVCRRYEKELRVGNELVRFSIRVWTAVCLHPLTPDGFRVFLLGEHPEDLGGHQARGSSFHRTSIWQIQAIRDLVGKPGTTLGTFAISQCCWGAPYRGC